MSGVLATELGLLTQLTNLDLRWNEFSGSLPTELGLLTNLTNGLKLEGNYRKTARISGTLPTQLLQLTKLESVTFQVNDMSGVLPTQIAALSKLTELCGTPTPRVALPSARTELFFSPITQVLWLRKLCAVLQLAQRMAADRGWGPGHARNFVRAAPRPSPFCSAALSSPPLASQLPLPSPISPLPHPPPTAPPGRRPYVSLSQGHVGQRSERRGPD